MFESSGSKFKEVLANYVQLICIDDRQRVLIQTQKNPLEGLTAKTVTRDFLAMYKAAVVDRTRSHSGQRTTQPKYPQKIRRCVY